MTCITGIQLLLYIYKSCVVAIFLNCEMTATHSALLYLSSEAFLALLRLFLLFAQSGRRCYRRSILRETVGLVPEREPSLRAGERFTLVFPYIVFVSTTATLKPGLLYTKRVASVWALLRTRLPLGECASQSVPPLDSKYILTLKDFSPTEGADTELSVSIHTFHDLFFKNSLCTVKSLF